MNAANRERVKELLSQASRLPRQERAAFIQRAAGADWQSAAEALDLLNTLDDPAFMVAPTGAGLVAALSHAVKPTEGPGTVVGPYKLLQLIGEGGFGSVYLAEQAEPVYRRVALKIIKAGMNSKQVIARFEVERQAVALMDHPNIARVLDAGSTESGLPYFVMELVRGEPITKYCDRERLSVSARLELFRDVCHAVQHAHQKGIMHRDLKPSNILVTVADGEPLPKVIDFGIAKPTAARLTDKTLFTELHQIMGTPEYMSPEQAEVSGVDIDTRSDIYSLGVLLYELLVGSTPLEHARLRSTPMAEVQRLIREEDPPRPSVRFSTLASSSAGRFATPPAVEREFERSSAISIARCRRVEPILLTRSLRGDLDWIVMKCLEKDRRRRYATASALAEDVGRYLTKQPVVATPPRVGYKLRKFVQRNRTLVVAGGLLAIVLLLGTVGTTFGLVWAVREKGRAAHQQWLAQQNEATARMEADRANNEAAQAQAINDYMREVLSSADPARAGADVRLVDVLSAASESATQRFAEHPLQEAQVRDMLGQVYQSLSMSAAVEKEYGRALILWQEHADELDPRRLLAESRYAAFAASTWRSADAKRMLVDLLPRLERVFGVDDPRTLTARVTEALAMLVARQTDEAEARLLELHVHPNLADEDIVQSRILRGLILVMRWRATELPRVEKRARLAEIEPLAVEWIERSTRAFGPLAPYTLQAQLNLIEATCAKGEYEAAVVMCRDFLAQTAEPLADCHELRTRAMNELAYLLAILGEVEEPADLYHQAIACRRTRDASNSPDFLSELSDALRYFDHAGRGVEGEALVRELIDNLQRLGGGGHGSMVFGAEVYLPHFISMQDRLDEAELLFQDLLARERTANRYDRARLHLFHAAHLVRKGLYAPAEQELFTTVDLIDGIRLGTLDSHPDDVILGFITLYDAWGKPDDAEAYRRLQAEVVQRPSTP